MNLLLIFFAIPIAVIIFSIILQKIFRCPFIVASIVFAVFLIVAVIIGTFEAVVAAIAYTLLALLTAYLVMLLCRINWDDDDDDDCTRRCCCCHTTSSDTNVQNTDTIGTNGTTCTCNQVDNNTITVTANIQPTANTNGRRGRFYGTYR